ncbi:MAG: GGDEF domain-containing protein [Pseudorhodoplanes sp.]|jgi:diguanylate cyclase (GGDEF)-like protein|nr:GGDEF domain-containing protein [Pseudorhodoplanes sp.]
MWLDLPTLFIAATCIAALLGLFLLGLWFQDRSIRALGWWASAYLVGGFAVSLWILPRHLIASGISEIATALLFISCGMVWSGARRFHGRQVLPLAAVTGAFVWLLASQLPAVSGASSTRVVLSSLIIAAYAALTAMELRRERRNPKIAKLRALIVPILHGVVFLSPILVVYSLPDAEIGGGQGFFAAFALLVLLYVVGTAFIVVVMAKEHSAQVHKTAAMTDYMTGLYNRRGFLEVAQKLIAAQRRKGESVTVLMFDLDHFKSINDRFGHDVGDEALRTFAATASSNMRGDDIVGRLGGEEFAAILPGNGGTAFMVAERVRLAFEVAGVTISGHDMNATVSIGAAESPAETANITALLTRADLALYRAKTTGRNRVVVEGSAPSTGKSATEPVTDISAPSLVPPAGMDFVHEPSAALS